jgi:hypothetical protein
MKKVVIFVIMLTSFTMCWTGCSDKKHNTDDSTAVDSTDRTAAVDTMEQLISEAPMPKAADELFDDFIFNFAANRKLQYKRIKFPLHVYNGTRIDSLQKSQWKMDHFFMRQGYYTLIFDNLKQMNVVKDTSIKHVVIEKISLRKNHVKQYIFNRINGQWMMTSINNQAVYQSTNASFLKFYQRFAVDSAFQSVSLINPVHFVGPDPDDDFSTMEGIITPDTWPAFAPKLPSGLIYNIIYGQHYRTSMQKIFVMRGIANGMEVELTFKKIGKHWKLAKLSN